MRTLFHSIRNATFVRHKTLGKTSVLIASAAIAVTTLTTLSTPVSSAEAPALSTNPSLVARATALRRGDAIGNRLERSRAVQITVALKLRNRDALDSFIAANSAQRGASGGIGAPQPMSAEQLAVEHLPTQAQTQAVVDFLERSGFRNIAVAPNRLLVTADGNASAVESAFRTRMVQVTTREGRDAHANADPVVVPDSLQDTILAVIGLQTVHEAKTLLRIQPQDELQLFAITGHNPTEFSSIYSAASLPNAAGVDVGIITEGRLTQTIADLNTFTANNGLPTVTTQTVNTGGTSSDTRGVGEWNLDSQSIVGAAGGQVGKIVFYNMPSMATSSLTRNINTVVSANAVKIINVSLGLCETDARSDGSVAAQEQSFAIAAAQGQTFSVSTGDSGADECGDGGTTPSWPASSQYVVAVSGTLLDASSTTWNSEVVWNDAPDSATGGSQSTFEPKPNWQNGFVSGSTRGVADIAFDGSPRSGARILVNGRTQQIGGTSLSAPIFAGLWARVVAVKGANVGFAAPLLYALPAADFHDITSGNNNGVSAGPGYDLVTGRGSLIMSSAINHIGGTGNTAPVANFTVTTSGLTATFTDTSTDSDGSIASRSWNFGDGVTSTATNPSHTYATAGTYSVVLTVVDNGGLTHSKTQAVTVSSANKFFQNTTPLTINDNSTINSTIAVSGLTGAAPAALKVAVNITHTYRGDLKVDLIAPNGTMFNLWNRTGGGTDNLNMTFTVNASSIAAPNGTWTLRVADQATLDTGRLNNWSLQF